MNLSTPMPTVKVAALYRSCRLERFAELKQPVAASAARGIKGTLLLAPEGLTAP
jgi:UPF0176 protein